MSARGRALGFALAPLLASACMNVALNGRATDESTKTYTLADGGEVHVANTNGKIDIQGVDGSTVEVRIVRIARATTDAAARELLPRIAVTTDVRPDRVSVESDRSPGILMGASIEVQYFVKAPRRAAIDVVARNGHVTLTGLLGKVHARSTNGGIAASSLGGPVDAASTNGSVSIDLAAMSGAPITLGTTNGSLTLILPADAHADLEASTVNGGINVSGLQLQVAEQTRRRLVGKINGGGSPIQLKTTNGGVRIRTRGA